VNNSFHVEGASTEFTSYIFSVERRTVSDGVTTFERDVAVHPGAVAILAVNERDEVGFIRQYRATFDDYLLEVPAGTRDVVGEEPLATAKRELLEELGCEASEWTYLGRFMNSPGWTNQVMVIFEARGLTYRDRAPAGPEERTSTVEWIARDDVRALLRNAPAIDSTTAILMHRLFGDFFDEF
jgi:8-oxo-dGTP pyrophosphatase MutT (NUDIX family)